MNVEWKQVRDEKPEYEKSVLFWKPSLEELGVCSAVLVLEQEISKITGDLIENEIWVLFDDELPIEMLTGDDWWAEMINPPVPGWRLP